jgi:hypothetical protein
MPDDLTFRSRILVEESAQFLRDLAAAQRGFASRVRSWEQQGIAADEAERAESHAAHLEAFCHQYREARHLSGAWPGTVPGRVAYERRDGTLELKTERRSKRRWYLSGGILLLLGVAVWVTVARGGDEPVR